MDIPTSWSVSDPPGAIEHNNAGWVELGQAWTDFQFRNREPAPIQALAVIMEYADAEGETIDRVPAVAAVVPGLPDLPPNVLSPEGAWKRALSPGDSARMGATSEGIRTGRCPVRARATFASLQFTDGSIRTFSSPEWQLGPTPSLIPRLPETVPDLPVEAPVSLLTRVKISASGSVRDVVSEESANPKLVDWIRERMKNWKFHPALFNGNPTDSELTVLFLIHAKGMVRFSEIESVLKPVTLIQFMWTHDRFPQADGIDRWTVMYGFLPEGSAPEFPLKGFLPMIQKASDTRTHPAQ